MKRFVPTATWPLVATLSHKFNSRRAKFTLVICLLKDTCRHRRPDCEPTLGPDQAHLGWPRARTSTRILLVADHRSEENARQLWPEAQPSRLQAVLGFGEGRQNHPRCNRGQQSSSRPIGNSEGGKAQACSGPADWGICSWTFRNLQVAPSAVLLGLE